MLNIKQYFCVNQTVSCSGFIWTSILILPSVNNIISFFINKALHILPYHTRTKWHERKSCHLEELHSKWNSNYRNAPNTTHYQVSKCHFPSKKYNPYKIDEDESTKNKYVGSIDQAEISAAKDYFDKETDSLKTLVNAFIGYDAKCFGISNVEVKKEYNKHKDILIRSNIVFYEYVCL